MIILKKKVIEWGKKELSACLDLPRTNFLKMFLGMPYGSKEVFRKMNATYITFVNLHHLFESLNYDGFQIWWSTLIFLSLTDKWGKGKEKGRENYVAVLYSL